MSLGQYLPRSYLCGQRSHNVLLTSTSVPLWCKTMHNLKMKFPKTLGRIFVEIYNNDFIKANLFFKYWHFCFVNKRISLPHIWNLRSERISKFFTCNLGLNHRIKKIIEQTWDLWYALNMQGKQPVSYDKCHLLVQRGTLLLSTCPTRKLN